jgi:hypothetical protein
MNQKPTKIRALHANVAMFFMGLALWTGAAHALELRVKGKANLEVSAVAAGTLAQVSGTLSDETGRAIGYRSVVVRIIGPQGRNITQEVSTKETGQFIFQEELPPGEYRVVVERANDIHFEGDVRDVSMTLEPVAFELDAIAPEHVFGRESPVLVYANARAAGVPVTLGPQVYLNGVWLGQIDMDTSGRGSFNVNDYLKEGINTLELVLPPSNYRDEVRANAQIRFTEKAQISADMQVRISGLSRGMSISGKVESLGDPLANLRVQGSFVPVLEGDDDLRESITESTRTDDEGNFEVFVPSLRLGNGVWEGRVRVIPNVGKTETVDVTPVLIEPSRARKVTGWFGVVAIVIGLLFIFQQGLLRLRERWKAWRNAQAKQKRDRQALEKEEVLVPVFLEEVTEAGARDDLGGVVWDVWQNQPAKGCQVRLVRGERHSEPLEVDSRGRFRFVDVEPGEWEMEVRGRGFVTGKMRVKVPHQGRWAAMRVDMVAVPLKIRRLYQTTLEGVFGDDPWGQLSPDEIDKELRQLLEVVEPRERESLEALARESENLSHILDALASLVEESYFSGKIYDEGVWLNARDLVVNLRRRAGVEVHE